MKDLDFDELDQAVSSVLGNDSPEEKNETNPIVAAGATEATPTPTPTVPAAEPASLPVAPAAPAAGSVTPVAAAVSPAARRRGQFLDMVHPSADMTSHTNTTAPAARKKISPVSTDISAPPTSEARADTSAALAAAESETTPEPAVSQAPAPEPVAVSPEPVAAQSTESTPDADETPAVKKDVAWPDPLDLTPVTDAPADDLADKEPAATTPDVQAAAVPAEPATPVAADASSTPFVTDAKVDKRPLGAFGTTDKPETDVTPEASPAEVSSAPNFDDQRPPEVTPPELQPDVVSVEAADKEFMSEDSESVSEAPANSGLSQSIPQQYQTPAETPDAAPHPIFDTDEYHQPLLPATHQKKKRGWLIVVIILALLVVGSALGYFAFIAGL